MISLPFALLALAAISLLAQGSSTPLAVNVRALSPVLVDEVRRGLMEASLNKRDQSWQNSTSLDKSFNKDVLFRMYEPILHCGSCVVCGSLIPDVAPQHKRRV